ncbi:DUF2911 domain-containing protein [Robiginitalea sp. SC105]|uniref:DUF2911 domain-containing protein n=1 Tax=Robiginitalea sp. SC105 TaxID=2762332 RepID=UPI001639E8D1|nr:DUF2911 domain-containing protein [Robiginitalea sp. SC105]MBC2839192.1 DUF2911 domain-containing protein [Robiginitalea sp. SC105]
MKYIFLIGFFLLAPRGQAQLRHPKASPAQEIRQEVGLCNIGVSYSRPAVRGRKIFGDLVPYGRIWRVGANESTKIRLSCPVRVGPHEVPAGTYALYAFPEETRWEIVFHRDTTHWGDGRDAFDPAEDLFRYPVSPEIVAGSRENFEISFDSIRHDGAQMIWRWDHVQVRIPISLDTHSAMEAEIRQALDADPSAQSYYEAARYLQETGREPERALAYVDKALELGGHTYYFHRVRSLILADLGALGEAVREAEWSRDLAGAEGKDEFVRMNTKNIRRWKKQLASEGSKHSP